jgi:hypothetical protein
MAEAPPPTPAPDAPGNIFEGYQAGEVTDMFAPAYLKGFAPSENALKAWTAYNRQGPGIVEQSRMPTCGKTRRQLDVGGDGVYGSGVPQT